MLVSFEYVINFFGNKSNVPLKYIVKHGHLTAFQICGGFMQCCRLYRGGKGKFSKQLEDWVLLLASGVRLELEAGRNRLRIRELQWIWGLRGGGEVVDFSIIDGREYGNKRSRSKISRKEIVNERSCKLIAAGLKSRSEESEKLRVCNCQKAHNTIKKPCNWKYHQDQNAKVADKNFWKLKLTTLPTTYKQVANSCSSPNPVQVSPTACCIESMKKILKISFKKFTKNHQFRIQNLEVKFILVLPQNRNKKQDKKICSNDKNM